MTRNEYEKIMEVVSALINERLGGLPLNQGIAPHVFELSYMYGKNGGTPLDHSTFRNFLRKVVPIVTDTIGKDGDVLVFDKNLGGGKWDGSVRETIQFLKWFLLDYTNETLITALPYIDEEGNLITDRPTEELLGRYLYNFQTGEFLQFREDKDGKMYLSTPSIRDNQIVFLENMPTLEDSIYYMKDGKLESFLASHEHAGLMSAEDKEKLDSINPDDYLKEVSIEGTNLPKENGVVDLPKATDTTLGVVKGGENVVIGADGSINVDVPVSIDEVVNLRSITTEPTTANEGDCYYNAAETKIHYYIDGAWDAGAEPQKSKVYFFEDGATIHQYRSDGDKLIEIQDTPQIATNTTVGIVKGGENVNIGADGSINVSFETIEDKIEDIEQSVQELPEPKEYDVATETELGLVKASADNNTAEAQATDGNVQVSAEGKMRVRKLVDKQEEGTNSYKFVVNPDETIENLKVGNWVKETELTIRGNRLLGSGRFSTDEDGFICELYTSELQESLVVGASLSMKIGNSSGLQGRETSVFCKADSLMNPVYHCTKTIFYYHTALVVKDVNGNVVFDSDVNGDTLYIESFKKDMLPLSLYAIRKAVITTEKYNSDKSENYSDLGTLKTYSYAYSVTSVKQIIKTPIGGNNIVLGKNGLLIESANSEAYVKVLEDGTIEHTFGATQNTGQANVIEQVKVNDVALPIANKSVNVKIAQNGELIEPDAEGVIDIKASEGGTATVPDAVEDNVVTFATEGQLKDSGKKIGGEEFGEYEQIPVLEVVGYSVYGEAGKLYGYCIDYDIVYKEKECLTPIGKMMYSAPTLLYYFNTEGDVNSGLSSDNDAVSIGTVVNYLNGERIINANTIATEKGVENFLTEFNLVTPKYKTGDVVYCTDVPNFHFGLMTWEEYERTPYNSMDTKMPIGLVVDPVKRTFLFCELLDKYFATSDNIETYFGSYTSFEDGSETFERIAALKGSSVVSQLPAFYGLRNSGYSSGSIFYVKNDVAYVPAIEEWKIAKEHLCTAFYGDDDSYAGFMDRLIALKTGETLSNTLFIGKNASGQSKLFYSQISTVGKTVINGTVANGVFNMNGEMPNWDNAQDLYACCPVFGIYTEEEENA